MQQHRYTIPLIYLTTFLFLLGETLQPAPRIQIYEDILCDAHYRTHGAPLHSHMVTTSTDTHAHAHDAHDCKIPAIQHQLSLLLGVERFSILIPSLLALPFAALADRYGHQLVLVLALGGVLLEDAYALVICRFPAVFPLRLIWAHFVFNLIGGGFTMVVTLLHVVAAREVEAERRTGVFLRIRAAGVGASVLGYVGAGVGMRVSGGAWVPWGIGLVCLGGAVGVAIVVLLSRGGGKSVTDDDEDEDDVNVNTNANANANNAERPQQRQQQQQQQQGGQKWQSLIRNPHILRILILVFLTQLGFDAMPLIMAVYVSKRFGWSFSNASFLNALDMAMELTTLLVILPLLLGAWTRSRESRGGALSEFTKAKRISQLSIGALAAGSLCLGFAPVIGVAVFGILLLALGTGQDSTLRSMSTDLVPPSSISLVYSAITMLRAIGGSVSGPLYAALYNVGLARGGDAWLGLPFLVAGALFVAALGVAVGIGGGGDGDGEEGEGEEEALLARQ
ncbi:MFS general substrate transporter [Pleomassaria siparia CBS 279.74]|uniref:MFS general substrate transporter n=1 Tax=Pleomassaria siparia CBS 279.74 TaxID=1314801 RepID=A0A6G1KD58_9PLEO|nr:MFS general substrate transporter [Pleomassaria siparia CBS 279.74]